MAIKTTFFLVIVGTILSGGLSGCSKAADATNFTGHGGTNPGLNLPGGGETRMEFVKIPGAPDQAWVQSYLYTSDKPQPFNIAFGTCHDYRTLDQWPLAALVDPVYQDLGDTVTITQAEHGVKLELPKVESGPATNGVMQLGIHYGGPGWQETHVDPAKDVIPGATYTVKLPKQSFDFVMAPKYKPPLDMDIGPVKFKAGEALTLDYESVPQPTDPNSRGAHFTYVFFISSTFQPLFGCLPEYGVDGHMVIPADVIAQLPSDGLLQHGRSVHYMEEIAVKDASDKRRYDLLTTYCYISPYTIE